MNNILAKGKPDWKSLKEHTLEVCHMAHLLSLYFPNIPSFLNIPDLFDELMLSALFHDTGKANKGFQSQLTENKRWGYRHEILSAAVCEGLEIDSDVKARVIRTLITHHKDFSELKEQGGISDGKKKLLAMFKPKRTPGNQAEKRFQAELNDMVMSEIDKLKSWMDELRKNAQLNKSYNYTYKKVAIHPVQNYVRPYSEFSILNIILRGLLIASDHFASAGLTEISFLSSHHFTFLENYQLRPHQKKAQEIEDNCLLIAPTGSGKTEAAMLWFKNQFLRKNVTHLFYILPYTASINAMYKRMSDTMCFGDKVVGISHSKALNALIRFYREQDYEENEALEKAINAKKQSKKLLFPILITTPWQLIQYFFSIKYFVVGITFMMDSAFVIDEIHCYDAKSMGLFLGMIKFLSTHFNTRFFIMSATIPQTLKDRIAETLYGNPFHITLDNEYLENICRHHIHLLDGQVTDYIDEIKEKLTAKKRVIIVANSVNSAIELFDNFIEVDEKILLHGKFTAIDRIEKEREVTSAQLLIGTQAIEVSLDIDYDEMYTEAAPLDALLQRFGRVNRQGIKGIADVFITKAINEASEFIYGKELICKTIDVLECVGELRESQIQELIDRVYSHFDSTYETTLNETLKDFNEMTSSLKAYEWDKESEKKFHKLFESINVIPYKFYDECTELAENNKFIEIDNYMISLTNRQFFKLRSNNIIQKHQYYNYWFVDMAYDSDKGLYGETVIIKQMLQRLMILKKSKSSISFDFRSH